MRNRVDGRIKSGQDEVSARPGGKRDSSVRGLRSGCTPFRAPLASGQSCGGLALITIIYRVAQELLTLYWYAVIISAIFTTLVSFGVLDTRNRMVWTIGDFLYRVTEPALRPIRRVLPSFGSIDFSPFVLIMLIYVAQMVLARIYEAIVFGNVQGLIL